MTAATRTDRILTWLLDHLVVAWRFIPVSWARAWQRRAGR